MKRLSVLAVSLMASTMLAGAGAFAQTSDNSPGKPETQAAAAAPGDAAPANADAATADAPRADTGSAATAPSDEAAANSGPETAAAESNPATGAAPAAAANAPAAPGDSEVAATADRPATADGGNSGASDGSAPTATAENDRNAQPASATATAAAQPSQDADHDKDAPATATAPAGATAPTADSTAPAGEPAQAAAADQPGDNKAEDNKSGENQAGKIADKDFGRLSQDGADAFEDIHLARVAIFEGRPGQAAKLVADAQAALDKAKSDNTVFMKAEADLHASRTGAAAAKSGQQSGSRKMAWLPLDAQIDVGEAYEATPDKDAAIVTARKHMEKGESAKALQDLKVAAVDVDYTLEVAPLASSIADIDLANDLMNSHDYYGASQALRKAEEGIRYDETSDIFDVAGNPKTASAKTDKSAD